MTINLHAITGQESGIILMDTGAGHQNVVANWGDNDGLPYFEPYLAEAGEPFPFVLVTDDDTRVDWPSAHRGHLREELSPSWFGDWSPLDNNLDLNESCMVYPLSNGWKVVAPENWN